MFWLALIGIVLLVAYLGLVGYFYVRFLLIDVDDHDPAHMRYHPIG